MSKEINAPVEILDLSAILDALSDATRRQVVLGLSRGDFCCSSFGELGPKTRMTYHFARLRKAGLIRATKAGTRRIMSLRRSEIDAVFPGLLAAVLAGVEKEESGFTPTPFPVG
jgi:DNA-binding transcriptional ArsR family regulator